MATWRRRATLDAWIDQVEALLGQATEELAPTGTDDLPAPVPPGSAERDKGWVSLRAG
jgi:hypothetical protein